MKKHKSCHDIYKYVYIQCYNKGQTQCLSVVVQDHVLVTITNVTDILYLETLLIRNKTWRTEFLSDILLRNNR